MKVSKTEVSWDIAKQACENTNIGLLRARLVVIKSSTKQIEIENYLKQVRAGNTQAHASMLKGNGKNRSDLGFFFESVDVRDVISVKFQIGIRELSVAL